MFHECLTCSHYFQVARATDQGALSDLLRRVLANGVPLQQQQQQQQQQPSPVPRLRMGTSTLETAELSAIGGVDASRVMEDMSSGRLASSGRRSSAGSGEAVAAPGSARPQSARPVGPALGNASLLQDQSGAGELTVLRQTAAGPGVTFAPGTPHPSAYGPRPVPTPGAVEATAFGTTVLGATGTTATLGGPVSSAGQEFLATSLKGAALPPEEWANEVREVHEQLATALEMLAERENELEEQAGAVAAAETNMATIRQRTAALYKEHLEFVAAAEAREAAAGDALRTAQV